MLKAILFDLDDTLIDWNKFFGQWELIETRHITGVYDYLCAHGHRVPDLETYKSEYFTRTQQAWLDARNTLIAPHVGKILQETAVAMGVPQDAYEMEHYLDAYSWEAVEGTVVFPDVFEVLPLLRDAGLEFGIVTNAFQPMRLRDVEMADHGLLEFFPKCRLSAADVGFLKPHPNIFKQALACMGTTSEETIFIGDNQVADIAGAQAAGMRAVMRITARTKPLLSGLIMPDAAINSLMELPAILDDWFPGWREQSA